MVDTGGHRMLTGGTSILLTPDSSIAAFPQSAGCLHHNREWLGIIVTAAVLL